MTIGIVFVASLSGRDHDIIRRYNHIDFVLNKVAEKSGHAIQSSSP